MKKLYLAAGALLLGSSALALAADADDPSLAAKPVGETFAASAPSQDNLIDKYASMDWSGSKAATPITTSTQSIDKSADPDAMAAKRDASAYADWSGAPGQPKLAQAGVETGPAGTGTMSATADKSEAVPATGVETGVGGPIDDGAMASADLTPRSAPGNYRPCEPGPGDDNCIQLYERGVRDALASWTAPTGGLADETQTAMGGPYEPVAGHSDASASGMAAAGETAMEADAASGPDQLAMASGEPDVDVEHQGIGGPVVSQSGYPPCSPGAGDDRCIQLYERGVTGDGN